MLSKAPQRTQRKSSMARRVKFCDEAEMAEILSDPALVKRLKLGSSDARNRKGRFVPTRRKA